MSCKMCFSWGSVAKQFLVPIVLALLAPIAALANSSSFLTSGGSSTCITGGVCIDNGGGMATGGLVGLSMTGINASTVVQIGNLQGLNLGTLELTTGAFIAGSGTLSNGGQFAPGTLTITNTVAYFGFTGVLFQGTFGTTAAPITWVFNGKLKNGKFSYTLTGQLNGTWEVGGLNLPVSGTTAQIYFESNTKYNGGPISLSSGTTTILTPEPSTLGLMGTGFVGIGLMARRKLKNKDDSKQDRRDA